VLPIGGIKEKVLGAHRAGIRTIILPRRNEADLEELPREVFDEMTFVVVDTLDDVLATALVPEHGTQRPTLNGIFDPAQNGQLVHGQGAA
jgi:ATP-dependent Lon protease